MERSYTVLEIDRMRSVVRQWCYRCGTHDTYKLAAETEDWLRPYLQGGADPSDVVTHFAGLMDEMSRRFRSDP